MKLWRNYRENQGMSLKILIRFPLESCCWKNVLWVNFHSLSGAVFCMNQLPGENVVCLFCTTRFRQHLHIKLTGGRGSSWPEGKEGGMRRRRQCLFPKLDSAIYKTKQNKKIKKNQTQKSPLKYLYRLLVCCITCSS